MSGEKESARPQPSRAERVYGAVGIAAIVLAVVFLLAGGPKDGEAEKDDGIPRIRLLEPAAGAALVQPATVAFDAGTPLGTDGGNRDGSLHVHVRVGGTELMSGPGSLRPLGGTRYRWTLPPVPAGTHSLRLYWSDDRHRVLADGASDSVTVTIR